MRDDVVNIGCPLTDASGSTGPAHRLTQQLLGAQHISPDLLAVEPSPRGIITAVLIWPMLVTITVAGQYATAWMQARAQGSRRHVITSGRQKKSQPPDRGKTRNGNWLWLTALALIYIYLFYIRSDPIAMGRWPFLTICDICYTGIQVPKKSYFLWFLVRRSRRTIRGAGSGTIYLR